MADVLNVGSAQALFLRADNNRQITVENRGPGTVYYGGPLVSSSSNDGNITSGSSATLTLGKFVVSASSSQLVVTTSKATEGFYTVSASPVAQPSAYTQTYSTATKTHAAPTAVSVATTAATNTTPYGYSGAAQADAIVTNLNALIVDVATVKKVLNSVIDDLQTLGLLS